MAGICRLTNMFLWLLVVATATGAYGAKSAVCSVDLVFVVDGSGSICQMKNVTSCATWQTMKQFLINVVREIDQNEESDNHRFSVVLYGSDAHVEFDFDTNTDTSSVIEDIGKLKYAWGQSTNTAAGLRLAYEVLQRNDRPKAPNVVVVLTDGHSADPSATRAAARSLNKAMARLIAIGVTEQINVDELNAMSSSPHVENQDFFRVQDVGKLNNIIQEVVITACGPVPSTENNKRHLIPVCPVDLVIVYDRSASICNDMRVTTCDDWVRLKTFMAKLVERLNPGELSAGTSRSHFAFVSFGHTARIEFQLTRFNTRAAVISSIMAKPYKPYENTNTADGLRMARRVFAESGRANIPKAVVVISDGHATEGFSPFDEAERLLNDNVRMISVGITDRINEEELKGMSSPPHTLNEDYYEVPSMETLNAVVSRVATSACCTRPGSVGKRTVDEEGDSLLRRLLRILEESH